MNKSYTLILHQQFTVFPGIEYIREIFHDDQDGRQCAYILRINRDADVRVDTVMDPDGQFKLQTPSVSAKACRRENETLIGVVNADFFIMTSGVPQGAAVMSGKIIKEEMRENTHFFGIYQDGTPVIGDQTTFENSKHALKMAVSGRDVLVDGETLPVPRLEPIPNRHPRTAVGICENGDLLLVVVDGRNPGTAEGLHLERLALYLQSLGAKKALNLDGGGSSLMALRMLGRREIERVNRPSDGDERPCANGIAVFAQHQGDGICHSAYVSPQQAYVAPGTRFPLSVHGLDSLLGLCDLPEDIRFFVSPSSGCAVWADGTFLAAENECDVTVSVSAGERVLGTAVLQVRTPDALHCPAACICAESEVRDLGVSATRNGCPVLTNSTSYHYQPLGDIGRFDEKGLFHAGSEVCEGAVLIRAKNNGPGACMHVRIGSLPQPVDVVPDDMEATGCTVWCDRPQYFSSRQGERVLFVETHQAVSKLQFSVLPHKWPKAVGMWVHAEECALPAFTLTVHDGTESLQSTAFVRGEPSDSVWTYLEAPLPCVSAQAQKMRIGVSFASVQGVRFSIDSFRLVCDYVNDDVRVPEIKRISIKKYAQSGDVERVRITAYVGVGDLPPCYMPIDYDRLRILIDDTECTGLAGYFGLNKGAASIMLHNYPVSSGVHRLRVCAQTYDGNQTWTDMTFDTDDLEIIG